MLHANPIKVYVTIFILIAGAKITFAEYSPYELCTIKWVESPEEIGIDEPWLMDVNKANIRPKQII